MTDSTEPHEGWYVVVTPKGVSAVLYRDQSGSQWMYGSPGTSSDDLCGWTLGPCLSDLLRDAKRWQWLRTHLDWTQGLWSSQDGVATWWFEFPVPATTAEGEESSALGLDEIERRIDTEIAREEGR